MRRAACQRARAVFQRVCHMRRNFGHCPTINQRALLGRAGQSGSNSIPRNARCQFLCKRIIDRVVDIDPVGADTRLAGIAEFRHQRTFDGGIDIGVFENDKRRISAQFQADPLDRSGALRRQQFAHCGRSGERELGHPRIAGQHATDRLGFTSDHAEHACRNPRLFG